MNAPERIPFDVQSLRDERGLRVDAVGIKGLGADSGTIEMRFPFFMRKAAPVSGVQSLLDYEVSWRASISEGGRYALWTSVAVPATSLCPCSKEISEYRAP